MSSRTPHLDTYYSYGRAMRRTLGRAARERVARPWVRAFSGDQITAQQARDAASQHCLELVRDRDREHFLVGMLLPKQARAGYFAVRAMNVELSTISETVGGNAATGQLRIGWWREAIAQVYEQGHVETFPQHPVVTALSNAISSHSLSRVLLEEYLDARDRDVCHDSSLGFVSMSQMELYAQHTAGAQMRLAVECALQGNVGDGGGGGEGESGGAGAGGVAAAAQVAEHVGVASGLCTLLRGVSHHARVGECYLPQCAMEKHGITARSIGIVAGDTENVDALYAVCLDVLDAVEDRLRKAEELQEQVPRAARVPLLPATIAQHFAAQLRKLDGNVLDTAILQPPSISLMLKLWWRATTGVYM